MHPALPDLDGHDPGGNPGAARPIAGIAALLAALVFCLILLVAAAWDLASYRIPNLLCLVLALAALVLALPHGGAEWLSRAASFGIVALAVLVFYMARTMGGGDVKLLAAAALWIPFSTLANFVLALAVAGGVQAAVTLVLRRRRAAWPQAGERPAHRRMPYAVSIAAAGLWWAWTTQLQAALAAR